MNSRPTTPTPRTIGNGVIVVARRRPKKVHNPAAAKVDPVKAARIEAETRGNPSRWGANLSALNLAQNAGVRLEAETRTKTQRITRYDCFALLNSRGGLADNADESLARLNGVRRFEDKLAERMRLEGLAGSGTGGRPIPISDRSLSAAACIDYLQITMGSALFGLLVALVSPSVENGQPVNNWRNVVQRHTGEFYHVAQASLVRASAESLLLAWQAWDQRERRAA